MNMQLRTKLFMVESIGFDLASQRVSILMQRLSQ